MEEFVFTFGCGQELEGFFVRVFGTNYFDARNKMIEKFGEIWSFQYTIDEWKKWENEAKDIGMPIEIELLTIK